MKHRPKRRMFTGSVLLLAAILAAAASGAFGQRPFRALDAADLAAADIWLGPPDVARSLSREEITALTELLQHVRITWRDNSYEDFCGQTCRFTLTMTDGTTTVVDAFSPFLIIDGTGWRTAHEPCEALNAFAGTLFSTDHITKGGGVS